MDQILAVFSPVWTERQFASWWGRHRSLQGHLVSGGVSNYTECRTIRFRKGFLCRICQVVMMSNDGRS